LKDNAGEGNFGELEAEADLLFRGTGFHQFDRLLGQGDEVDRLTPIAVAKGATLRKAPFTTYYGWYQSVLLDPEGNAFRINFGSA